MSDGAKVMEKLATLLKVIQQLCLAHGIHLAVIDVAFVKKQVEQVLDEEEEESGNESEPDIDYESDSDSQNEDSEGEDEIEDEEEGPEIVINDADDVPEFVESVNDLIVRLRKAVKNILVSPVKVWKLQQAVKKWQRAHGMDIKTLVSIVLAFIYP